MAKHESSSHLWDCNVLDTSEIMCMLFTKLPGNNRDVCSRNVMTTCRRHNQESDLTEFIHFVNDETLFVSYPIFSKEVVAQYMEKKPNSRRNKMSSFAQQVDGKEHVEEKSDDCTNCIGKS